MTFIKMVVAAAAGTVLATSAFAQIAIAKARQLGWIVWEGA